MLKKVNFWMFIVFFLFSASLWSADLKPFTLGFKGKAAVAEKVKEVTGQLTAQQFSVVGEYKPLNGKSATVIVVTDSELQKIASQTPYGAFGSAIRVGVAEVKGEVQVSYMNLSYWVATFQMKGNIQPIKDRLVKALGSVQDFGSEKGISDEDLRDYHYMISMPYFQDFEELGTSADLTSLINKIDLKLADKNSSVEKVYKIEMPSKKQVVYGVSFKKNEAADDSIMSIVDGSDLSHLAHLPYEFVVTDDGKSVKAIACSAKFRIAISFPDLTMTTFTKIISAPGSIKDALVDLVK